MIKKFIWIYSACVFCLNKSWVRLGSSLYLRTFKTVASFHGGEFANFLKIYYIQLTKQAKKILASFDVKVSCGNTRSAPPFLLQIGYPISIPHDIYVFTEKLIYFEICPRGNDATVSNALKCFIVPKKKTPSSAFERFQALPSSLIGRSD